MKKAIKFYVLTLAAWLRQGQVTRAINTVRDRPLKNQPDWFLGWAMLAYKNDPHRGAKILYAAARAERDLRGDLERFRPEVRAATAPLPDSATILFHRWRVECPSPDSRTQPLGFTIPDGSKMINEAKLDHGKRHRFIIDTPAGENITITDQRVTAIIIGFGSTEGELDASGEHLNIKG